VSKHAFRRAIETHTGPDELIKLLAPDVVLHAPMLTKPIHGSQQAVQVLGLAAQVAAPIEYTLEVDDGNQTILVWSGAAGGFHLEAATILIDNPDGLISEIRVVMRPWPVVTLFRNAMHDRLADSIPPDLWELQPKLAPTLEPRHFTSIGLRELESAPSIVLHSPMLAKAVTGKAEVEESVRIAHQVQSASSYTTIIATPKLVFELFDCDADGYPMEGLWLRRLDEQGRVTELTVMLRPYPAVTVLRNRARDLAEGTVLSDPTYWDLRKAA
jgi:hypothetical protein